MEVFLIRYGEIALKGKNRAYFEEALAGRLRRALAPWGGRVRRGVGRFFAEAPDLPEVRRALARVFGVASYSPALRLPLEMPAIQEAVLRLAEEEVAKGGRTFRVQARRAEKRFPLTSEELNRRLGALVLERFPGLKVDLEAPDFTLFLEVRLEGAYLYTQKLPGPGGLPVGVTGRALALLSGGIDSPVAAWMGMKRGLTVDLVHFDAPPAATARGKVEALAEVLAEWGGPFRLFVVPFTKVQLQIGRHVPERFHTLVLRRMMVRFAGLLAEREGALALLTGESLGQVASQTLESLRVVDEASALPILRPLVGLDKEEIVALAKRVESYEISIRPEEDCCVVFAPRHPATRPRLDQVQRAEAPLDVAALLEEALAGMEILSYGTTNR
ncbi:tRNA uracil 4-sulfurtransferase ThiI [Thermus filiformis]|uniref:Probable tRNA sulfurtransferase n=1 Tax=Thermus filiformis TaxID=276 RepID=A0A0A2WSA2_THEFI|nr:tRNA uracil 4-sulfurtransferase ThiI [Thermus filiformis]KGQ21632.2 hypothetical protein THFILI_09100 [Thermus filiformis]